MACVIDSEFQNLEISSVMAMAMVCHCHPSNLAWVRGTHGAWVLSPSEKGKINEKALAMIQSDGDGGLFKYSPRGTVIFLGLDEIHLVEKMPTVSQWVAEKKKREAVEDGILRAKKLIDLGCTYDQGAWSVPLNHLREAKRIINE